MTDISKEVDCINHPLLIAKIDSYGVSPLSPKIIFFYLSNHTAHNPHSSSKRSNILHGVPHGSILGPLLFNIDLIYSTNVKKVILLAMPMTQNHTLSKLTLNQLKQNHRLLLNNKYSRFKANPGNHLSLNPETPINVSIGDIPLTTSTTETWNHN